MYEYKFYPMDFWDTFDRETSTINFLLRKLFPNNMGYRMEERSLKDNLMSNN